MEDNFLESALREEARLVRRLAVVRAVIADYRGSDSGGQSTVTNAMVRPPVQAVSRATRAESQSATVVRIAEEFLSTARRRAPSAEIYSEIAGRGIVIPGQKPDSVVSSYLSSSPKFDNVRGQGYGLSIWNSARPQPADAHKENEPSSGFAVGSDTAELDVGASSSASDHSNSPERGS
jgi:hypothetical protein